MDILSYLLLFVVGVSLGLVGSGGAILVVPILVYLRHFSPTVAAAYALFIVGVAALTGSVQGWRSRLLDVTVLAYFGVPSVLAIFVMRRWLLPNLPDVLFTVSGFVVHKNFCILFTFACLTVLSALSMLRKGRGVVAETNNVLPKHHLIAYGILIGLLTGFVGVGGGFLMIPTLVHRACMSMKIAVRHSLVLIAANGLVGFLGSVGTVAMDWTLLLRLTICAVVGMVTGLRLARNIPNERLKIAFAWVVLAIGVFVFGQILLF